MDQYHWKYHDCFLPEDKQKDYVLPYFVHDDPYEASEEELLRAKWLHDQKLLNGDFRPAQLDKSLERLTPGQLPDIVNYVKKVIMVDWAEVNFIIGTNPDSFIEIKFDQKSVDTEHGLKAYMNTLVKSHDVINQFNLRRVIKFWGYKLKGHVYFMLAPPWIKFNSAALMADMLNHQLDDANLYDDGAMRPDNETVDSSLQGRQQNEVNDRMGSIGDFKVHQMVHRKTNFIKEP